MITLTSFGYKHKAPALPKYTTKHHNINVRKTRNPNLVKELKKLTGLDPAVITYVSKCGKVKYHVGRWFKKCQNPKYGGYYLPEVINFGDYSGTKQSVVIVELLAAKLREVGVEVAVVHRDLEVK